MAIKISDSSVTTALEKALGGKQPSNKGDNGGDKDKDTSSPQNASSTPNIEALLTLQI